MSGTRSTLASLLLMALLVASCGAPQATTGAVTSPNAAATSLANIAGGTVTIRINGDWGNPIDGGQTVTTANGMMIAWTMYSTLLYLDPTNGKAAPYLAASWRQTPTSVTFKLRDDVTCADGTKVTATVVYNSFARLISPELKSTWPATTFGPGPYTIAKDDAAGTFTFSVTKPNARLLPGFASPIGGIICPKGLQAGTDFTKESYGSGPFIFKSGVQGSEYLVTKRDGWTAGPNGWKTSDPGFPDTLVIKPIASDTTAANLLLTGGVDITLVSGPDVQRLATDPRLEHKVSPRGAPYILALNEAPERATSSEVVRKAVATALDPKAWTVAAGEPDAPVSTNIQATPGGYCYTDLSAIMPKPSVPNARAILLQGGYTAGADGKLQKDGKPLKLRVVGTSFTGSGVEYIADTLNQVGITVDLVNTDYNTFAQNYGRTDYDVIIGLHGGDTGLPSNTAQFMIGPTPEKGGSNRIRRNDPQLTALVDKAYGASTEAEACVAWKEFNTYVIQNSIALPWAAAVTHWFSRKGEFSYVPNGPTVIPFSVRRTK